MRPRGDARRDRIRWAACAIASVVACLAHAAPRMSARPAFAPLRPGDDACVVVSVENDGEARQVTLRVQRDAAGAQAAPGAGERDAPVTELRLDLPPLARKRAWIRVLPSYEPRVRIDMIDRAEVVATTVADLGQGDGRRALIAVIGQPPPSLVGHARKTLEATVAEAAPEDLPGDVDAWPRAQAIAWPSPRSPLTQAQARTIDRLVRGGARLVVGVDPEEPDALARMGLGALLPAQPRRGPGLSIAFDVDGADPAAQPVGESGARRVARGFGEVILVPGPLDRGDETLDWNALLGIPLPSRETEHDMRRSWWSANASLGWRTLMREAAPRPPQRGALAVLAAFFVASVIVDGWLTRRAVKRGRRRRLAWLAFPLLVLVATAGGFTIADRASGGDMRMQRVDVVDVARDGSRTGRTSLIVMRGRSGDMSVESEGASLRRLAIGTWEEFSSWVPGGGGRVALRASADAALPVERASVRANPWDTLNVVTTWPAPEVPPLDPGATTPPRCQGARFSFGGTGGSRILVPSDSLRSEILAETDVTTLAGPTLVVALDGAVGPPIRIDGAALPSGGDVTIVRYALDPSAANTRAWGAKK